MPRVAYSEKDKERIRTALITVGLELMAKQGIQHTTVEQVYKKVGISRTFFYSFFSTKEDQMCIRDSYTIWLAAVLILRCSAA